MSHNYVVKLLLAILMLFVISFGHVSTSLAGSTSYIYDELDRLHAVVLGDDKILVYEYDEIGNLISKWVTSSSMAIITTSLAVGEVNIPYHQTLGASGGVPPYKWEVVKSSLPPGLTYNENTGEISGTPTTANQYWITVAVWDSLHNGTGEYRLISIVPPVAITTTSLSQGVANSPYSQTLTAANGSAPYTWSITSGSLPTGLALNPTTGEISGTPATAGNYPFTLMVRDNNGASSSATVTLAILGVLPDYSEMFYTPTVPSEWSTEGDVSISNMNNSPDYGLQLGDGFNTDGSISFLAQTTGNFSFWYYKFGPQGYYLDDADWVYTGVNAGVMKVSVNGIVVFSTAADTGWMKTPPIAVHAGDRIVISEEGNRDDEGALCSKGHCGPTNDPFYNVFVYIDDIAISNSTDTTAPVTTATPAGGSYSTAQIVTLSASEPATIYYTIDGTSPTPSSAVYSSPLTISTSTTLKFFAKDLAGNFEAAKTQTYTIVPPPPPPDTGSIITSTPGTYTHTFTGNATVTLLYLKGAGGQGADHDGSCPGNPGGWCNGLTGSSSSIIYDGTTKAIANGGGGGLGESNGADGTASNSIGGTNYTGGGGTGGAEASGYAQGNGGNGGAVIGGSFVATSGKVLTIIVGDINEDPSAGWDGVGGSVSISWH